MIFFFFQKNFFAKIVFSDCILKIAEVENIRKSFWRLKEGEKGKNFDKKVNSLTRYKIGGRRRVVVVEPFFVFTFFLLPSSARPSPVRPRFARKSEVKKFVRRLKTRQEFAKLASVRDFVQKGKSDSRTTKRMGRLSSELRMFVVLAPFGECLQHLYIF